MLSGRINNSVFLARCMQMYGTLNQSKI